MPIGKKIVPVTVNTDLSANYMDEYTARFIKNLTTYASANNTNSDIKLGQNILVQKSLLANQLYASVPGAPAGENLPIGTKGYAQVNRVYVWVWNSQGNHFIYRINGKDQSVEMVKIDPLFNFQLKPEYFIHNQGSWVEVLYSIDPETGNTIKIEDLYWTDGLNPMGYIRVNDCIATNGFDSTKFPYFKGTYDPSILSRMGLPTPNGCLSVSEISRTPADVGLLNTLLFKAWQFRISVTDVYGRPSEHCLMSDLYVPGINDCIGGNQFLPRCLGLTFDAGNPLWNSIDIEYSINNGVQWNKTETIFLYNGSPVGKWWTRQRNKNVQYNSVNNTITYIFCAAGEQNAVPQTETNRLENPLPKRCQSLNKIATLIGTGNNVDGFNPLSSDILDAITIEVIPPNKVAIQTQSITVYIPIYCPLNPVSGGVILNNKNYGAVFGGPTEFVWGNNNVNNATYGQTFPTLNQSGFIGYLNGGNAVISTQVYIKDGVVVDDPGHNGLTLGYMTFQKFVFTDVPPNTYIFRLASHLANPSTTGQQVLPGTAGTFNSFMDTSTTVWGKCPFVSNGYNIDIDNRNESQELIINVCDEDYDTFLNNPNNEILVIASLSSPSASYCDFIYIYESLLNNYPVELIKMTGTITYNPRGSLTAILSGVSSLATDFNGFGWQASIDQDTAFSYTYLAKCVKKTFYFYTSSDQIQFDKLYLDQVGANSPSAPPGQPVANPDFAAIQCNRIIVQGYIILTSNNNIGVPNVTVVLSRGQSAVTDDTGFYQIIAHDDISDVDGTRNDVVVFSGSTCNYKNIDGGCIPVEDVQIPLCEQTECSDDDPRIALVLNFEVIYSVLKGPLSGGTYGVGMTVWDWLGRNSFIQFIGYLTIPTITQSQTIGPSKIKLTIPSTVVFPKEVKYITPWITEELTIADYVTWIVDRFDLVDNTGNVNPDAPSQIRIWYSSLNEFNQQNNFNTTTGWEFLEPLPEGQASGSQQPYTNDVVYFWVNGDGTFYFNSTDAKSGTVKAISALVKYDQTGQYFLIDYTSDLAGLVANALIRLTRPRDVVNEEEPYYEQCEVIEVVNQIAQQESIILNFFDTYYLDRQIPVPAPVTPVATLLQYTQPVPTIAGATGYYQPIPVATLLSLRVFPFPFEHNSPSNFWGQGVKNIGRVNVRNPYESEIVSISQIALGSALLPNGLLSYLQYFDDNNKYTIPVQNKGGLVSIFFRQGTVFCIFQYGKVLIGYNNNTIKVDANGNVVAPSAADKFGNPEVDLKNDYGCQIVDKSTIMEIDGFIIWVDRNKGEIVRYDFSQIESFTKDDTLVAPGVRKGRHDAGFMAKVKSMLSSKTRYFVAGIDPIGKEYLLTDFDLANKSYINTERTYVPGVNETIRFDINTKDFKGWLSFTPERYAHLDGDVLSNQLFTFNQALPYSHYNVNQNVIFSTFYGIICERVFTLCVADEILKKKKPDWLELYGINCGYFVDEIINDSGQLSRILMAYFKQGEFMFSAPFLRDVNTPDDPNLPASALANKLLDGNPLFGEWLQIRFVSFPQTNNQYSELTGVMIFLTGDTNTGEKRGVLKKPNDPTT